MFRLELNDQEHQALSEAVRGFLSELRTEVSHTDRQSYRLQLREQEQTLKAVLSKLAGE